MSGSFAPRPDDHLVEPIYAGLSVGGRRFGFKSEDDDAAAPDAHAGEGSPAAGSPEDVPPMGAGLPHEVSAPLPPVRNSPVSVLAATLFLLGVLVVGMATMFLFGY